MVTGIELHKLAAMILGVEKMLESSQPLGKEKLRLLAAACQGNAVLSRCVCCRVYVCVCVMMPITVICVYC